MTTSNEEHATSNAKEPVVEQVPAASIDSAPAVLAESSTPWTDRWQGWSTRLIDSSKAISSTVQAASEQAVGQARNRTSACSLRRVRARRLQSLGEQVLAVEHDLINLLPSNAVGALAKNRLIENELRQLNLAVDESQSTPRP